MSWKYIMLQVGDKAMPVIFPGEFVHSFVAGAMQLVVEANDPKFDLRPKQLMSMLERGTAPVIGAGFIEGLAGTVSIGESESLGVKSRDQDIQIINNHPYEFGMPNPLSDTTELLILKRTIDLLTVRAQEISG